MGYLAWRYDQPKPIPDFHMEMWELCCSEAPQVALAAPRGHAKSTALSFAYALSGLLFEDFVHLLLISANESLAADFLNDLKIELQENEALDKDFGPFKFLKERENEIIVRTPRGKFRVIVKGAGQRMRGLKWERKRPDMVLCDDLEDDEIVLNEERREKFRRWFYGAVRPIVKSGGRIRLYGTIIHMDSLLQRTMPRGDNLLSEPLRDFQKVQKGWLSVKYRAHSDDYSHILWPAQFPEPKLRQIRAEYAEMGLLDVYGQEYLNNPIDEGTAYFRRQDFRAMKPGDYETLKTYYVGGDFAIGEAKKRAYTTFVVGGVDADRQLHIVDVRRGRWDTLEIIDEMYNIQERWNPEMWRLERENIQKTLKPLLDHENLRRPHWIPYDDKAPTKDKLARARAFQYRMRAGNVRFDKEADWYTDYEEELAHFPKWPTLDQVDASAWLGDLISEELAAPSEKELEEEEYQNLLEDQAEMGISMVTGY